LVYGNLLRPAGAIYDRFRVTVPGENAPLSTAAGVNEVIKSSDLAGLSLVAGTFGRQD
jgi:hypothetical protein